MKELSSLNIFRLVTVAFIWLNLFSAPASGASVGLDDQLRLIRGAFEDGLYDLVYPEATRFLEKAGNHKARGEVFLILGFIEKQYRNLNKAREFFNKATLSDDPEIRLQGYYQAATISWSKSDYLKAVDGFQAIVDENRGGDITEQAYYWLVLSLFQSQQFDEVIRKVTDITEHDRGLDGETLIQVIFYRAQSYFHSGMWTEAKTDLETVYEADTGQIKDDAALLLARLFLGWQNLKMADTWAIERLESGYNREAHLIRASCALENNDFSCARQHFMAIVQDRALDDFAQALFHWKIAACDLEIALNTTGVWWLPLIDFCHNNPNSPFVENAMAEFLRLSEISPVSDQITELLINSKKWEAARYGMQIAQLYLIDKNYDSALHWITNYFIQNENKKPDTNTRLLMARLLAASGDAESASAELLRLNIDGDTVVQDVDAVLQQAELFHQSGMYQQAASLFQHLLVAPESSDSIRKTALFRLGNAYFQMEQWVFACDVFRRFIEIYPDIDSMLKEQAMRRYALSCAYAREWEDTETAIVDYLTNFSETEYKGEMYYLRGLAEANQNKTEQALISMGLALDYLTETEYIENVKINIRHLKDFQNERDTEGP